MKKYILVFGLLLLSFGAQSQVLISLIFGDKLNSEGLEFGLEGGYNFSTITGFESNKHLGTLALGFYFDIRMKDQLSLSTGVMVKSTYGIDKLTEADLALLNAETYTNPGDYSIRLKYFEVPILLRYKFKNHIYAELGPQIGLMYKSYIQYDSDYEGQDARIRSYNKDEINRIDIGGMIGLGYILDKGKGVTLGVKYYYGFVDVVKDIPGTKNSSFLVKVNIPIGREKAAKKAAEKAAEQAGEN